MPSKSSNQIHLDRPSPWCSSSSSRSPQRVQDGAQAPWQHTCYHAFRCLRAGQLTRVIDVLYLLQGLVAAVSTPGPRLRQTTEGRFFFLNREPPDDPAATSFQMMFYADDFLQRSGTLKPPWWLNMQRCEEPRVWMDESQDPAAPAEIQESRVTLNLCIQVWTVFKNRGKIYCECIAAKQCSLFQYSKKSCFHVLNSSVGAFHIQSWLLIYCVFSSRLLIVTLHFESVFKVPSIIQ